MDGNDSFTVEYGKSDTFGGCHIFAPASHIERYLEDAIFRFHEAKKDDPIMAATNLFGIYIHLKIEMEEFVA